MKRTILCATILAILVSEPRSAQGPERWYEIGEGHKVNSTVALPQARAMVPATVGGGDGSEPLGPDGRRVSAPVRSSR